MKCFSITRAAFCDPLEARDLFHVTQIILQTVDF